MGGGLRTSASPGPPRRASRTPSNRPRPPPYQGTEEIDGECVACPLGAYNDEAGQACRPCAVGTKSAANGSLTCSPCPYESTTTQKGSTQCDACIEGYYRDPAVEDESEWCAHCPENAYCAGDSLPGTTLLPVPLVGYW